MKAAIYARVSTADGRQEAENQLAELRRFAATQSWEITHEYIDQRRFGAQLTTRGPHRELRRTGGLQAQGVGKPERWLQSRRTGTRSFAPIRGDTEEAEFGSSALHPTPTGRVCFSTRRVP
jgi:hypothetical protein